MAYAPRACGFSLQLNRLKWGTTITRPMRALTHLCAVTVLCVSSSAQAANEGAFWPAEVSLPNSRQITFISAINGEPYALFVSIPFSPPPKNGYPVLYVLDGEAYFPTAASFSVILQRNAAVIVGIDHNALRDKAVATQYSGREPDDVSPAKASDMGRAYNNLRDHDYSLALSPEHVALEEARNPGQNPANYGGLDDFLKVVETEIKPKIDAILPIDKARQGLFGHSIGGLAVVHALFTAPNSFSTFIASSPVLSFDANAVLKDESKFSAIITSGRAAPRIMIATGADEEDDIKLPAGELARRLKGLSGAANYKVKFSVILDADHPATPYTSLGQGMHFAFDQ